MKITKVLIFIALTVILAAACAPAATEQPLSLPETQADDGAGTEDEATQDGSAEQQETYPQPETSECVTETPSNEPVVLTINGDGVNRETTWTLSQLKDLRDGYREITYSTTNNWPKFSHMTAHGVALPYLLHQACINDGAASFKFTSVDGYAATLTYDQVFGAHYSYADHSSGGSSGASAVEPVIAWAWGDEDKFREENLRPFFGQSGPYDVNTSVFVKDLCMIGVSTSSAEPWDAPGVSVPDTAPVPKGTAIELLHDSMDSVRVYYTIDGSEPDYDSPVYNLSASYFQPQLIKPIILTENVTVKAFAAGYGKERSPIATFNYTVE